MATRNWITGGAVTTALVLLAACGDGVGANGAATLDLQVATAGSATAAAPEHRVIRGADTLIISSVQLVAREIELEAEDGACAQQQGSDSTGADTASATDRDCAEVETGPVLLDLPLTPGARQTVSTAVQAGTYNEVEFKIRPPDDDDAADLAFRNAHPALQNLSILATGTFNGTPFTFTSDVEAEQELRFPTPIVATGGPVALTIFVDVDAWFVTPDGAELIDPALAGIGTQLRATVESTIKASFEAFEDQNHDGSDDSGHGGSDG